MPRHHYVPQFYLRGFVDPDTPSGHEPYLWLHEPGSGWEKRAPKNAAERTGYYAFPDSEGNQSEEAERMLSRVEDTAAQILRNLLAERSLSVQARAEFALFIALMQARIPGQVEHIAEAMAETMRRVIALLGDVGARDPAELKSYLERVAREIGEPRLAEMPVEAFDPSKYTISVQRYAAVGMALSVVADLSHFIAAMGWTLFISRSAGPFITSDYPVGVVDPVAQSPRSGLGLRPVEVSFPLSSGMALVAGWRHPWSMHWRLADEAVVEQINLRTALRARQLFAPKETFPGANQILADREAPLRLAMGPKITRLNEELGYQLELGPPPVVPTDLTWLRPLLSSAATK